MARKMALIKTTRRSTLCEGRDDDGGCGAREADGEIIFADRDARCMYISEGIVPASECDLHWKLIEPHPLARELLLLLGSSIARYRGVYARMSRGWGWMEERSLGWKNNEEVGGLYRFVEGVSLLHRQMIIEDRREDSLDGGN